jgi:hypothetical protein
MVTFPMSENKALAVTECSERMAECEAMAKRAPTLEQQTILRDMAKAWQQLGEKIEKDGNGPEQLPLG